MPRSTGSRRGEIFRVPRLLSLGWVRELLRKAKVQDINSVGEAFDHLLRLLEKAEKDGNYNACAQLMRQRLQAHGMLRDRIVLSAESQLNPG